MARETAWPLGCFQGDNVLLSGLSKRSLLNDNAFQRLALALIGLAFAAIGKEADLNFGTDSEGECVLHVQKIPSPPISDKVKMHLFLWDSHTLPHYLKTGLCISCQERGGTSFSVSHSPQLIPNYPVPPFRKNQQTKTQNYLKKI